MNPQILRDMLNRRPFESFIVRLSSGDAYEVRHPEMALLLKNGIYIALPAPDGDFPERAVYCPFLHVAAAETLALA